VNVKLDLRPARALLLLANFGKEGQPEPIIAKVSQEALAEMIGTTRSRVSFFMNKFRKLGLIAYNGQIEIHSSLLNVVLHEEPHINSLAQPRVLSCIISALGQKRTNQRATIRLCPLWSNSGQTRVRLNCPLTAISGVMGFAVR
jgi:hypothetical protein